MRIPRFLLLMVAFAAGTAAVGWWAVPVIAALWTILTKSERGHSVLVGLAAALAWAALVCVAAARGPVLELANVVGGVMSIGAAGALALTLLYPGLVAAATASVTRALVAARTNAGR